MEMAMTPGEVSATYVVRCRNCDLDRAYSDRDDADDVEGGRLTSIAPYPLE
jgi:hypothetical protein